MIDSELKTSLMLEIGLEVLSLNRNIQIVLTTTVWIKALKGAILWNLRVRSLFFHGKPSGIFLIIREILASVSMIDNKSFQIFFVQLLKHYLYITFSLKMYNKNRRKVWEHVYYVKYHQFVNSYYRRTFHAVLLALNKYFTKTKTSTASKAKKNVVEYFIFFENLSWTR